MLNVLLVASLAAAPSPVGLQPKNRPYDAQHYKLEVHQGEGGTFNNVVTITLKPSKALPELEFDAYDLKFTSAKVDGEEATFTPKYVPETRFGTVAIKPKKAVAAGKEVTVELAYSVTAGTSIMSAFVRDSARGT